MTYPPDHNQQLYAYLQALRQLLEPLTALTAAMVQPGAWPLPGLLPMPTAPPYPPPAPPPPPAPGSPPPGFVPPDYAQQLVGYLQSWRQYLEQATGTPPAAEYQAGTNRPRVPVPPDRPDAGRTNPPEPYAPSPYTERSTATPTIPPTLAMAPALTQSGSQVPDDLRQAAVVARGPQLAGRPVAETGPVRRYDVTARQTTGQPQPTRAAAPGASIRPAVRSRFAGLADRALRNPDHR
ncbi:hypothetical protein [Mycolicibacterium sp. HK-90]|uniref:hypothetical protein n=1 Tax=Mycolicibacterium sp. HK-90 TaxID=3056937 RepID=UPI00265AD823|nr:hypothetical protein [Mycolicibacterium sp. HK-90]WKG06102.1 hypothetical protein QU592_13955 [Mycolicibacterium sp. HK-90]